MKIEILEGISYPEPLIREWEELLLAARFKNPFLTPLWNEIWLRHFGKSLPARAILFRESGGSTARGGSLLRPRRGRGPEGTDPCGQPGCL